MAVDEYLCFMFSGGLAVFVRAVLLLLQGDGARDVGVG